MKRANFEKKWLSRRGWHRNVNVGRTYDDES